MSDKIACPKCGSDQITANKKGYSVGKAAAGVILTGGIGLIAGAHGSGKVKITCLACGETWKPGQHLNQKQNINRSPVQSNFPEWKINFMNVYESGDYAAAEEMYNKWYGSTTNIPFTERYEQFKKGGNESKNFAIVAWIILIVVIVVAIWVI